MTMYLKSALLCKIKNSLYGDFIFIIDFANSFITEIYNKILFRVGVKNIFLRSCFFLKTQILVSLI